MSGLDNTLYLIVYKDIFERIMSNEKVVEYRECTKYWDKRLKDKSYSKLRITNGYGNDTRPYVLLRYLGYDIVERDGKPHYAIPIQRALWKEYRQEVNGEIINE